jgi:RNA polymerase sigma factor (sigma-70 family)
MDNRRSRLERGHALRVGRPCLNRRPPEEGLRRCRDCNEERDIKLFKVVKKKGSGSAWRSHRCRECDNRILRDWEKANPERVRATNQRRNKKIVAALKLARALGESDPSTLDALRRSLVEKPPEITDDEPALAYFRGYLSGVGRSKRESEDVEEYKDLVFRIAAEKNARMGKLSPSRRISYEDMVSVGYEALLECLRSNKRERPLIAVAIRRRLIDEYRRQFGRYADRLSVAGATNFQDCGEDGDVDMLAQVSAVYDEEPEGELFDHVRKVMAECPGGPRMAVFLWWRTEGLTLKEIGERAGLTESRVCQLFSRAEPFLIANAERLTGLTAPRELPDGVVPVGEPGSLAVA